MTKELWETLKEKLYDLSFQTRQTHTLQAPSMVYMHVLNVMRDLENNYNPKPATRRKNKNAEEAQTDPTDD
jgi:hypothetical protein